jgi:hypothetical protein
MKSSGSRSGSWFPKGRRKVIREFTRRDGLQILAALTVVMLLILLFWGMGIIRADID